MKMAARAKLNAPVRLVPDNLGPILLAHHHEQLVASDAGVIDQPVDRAEFLLDRVDHLAHALEISNVNLEGQRLDSERPDFVLE